MLLSTRTGPRPRKGRLSKLDLELANAQLEARVLALQLAHLLAVEDEREELTGRDATAAVAWGEQQALVDLPAIPARPRHVAGEDREEFDCSGIRVAGRVVAQAEELLKRLERGEIGREALRE